MKISIHFVLKYLNMLVVPGLHFHRQAAYNDSAAYHTKVYTAWNPRSLLVYCKEQGLQLDLFCKNVFKVTVTNNGICYGYNALPIESVLKTSRYKDIVSSVFKETGPR
jgi:hypothetical protein